VGDCGCLTRVEGVVRLGVGYSSDQSSRVQRTMHSGGDGIGRKPARLHG